MDLLYWSRHFRNMPGEGDLPVRRLHAARSRRPAMTATSRSRSSTTSSAAARQVDLRRRPALAGLADGPGAARGARLAMCRSRRCPTAIGVEGRRVHRVRRQSSQGAEGLGKLLDDAGLFRSRPARLQGRHRCYRQGEHQHRRQHRARGFRPLLLRRPRHVGLRHRAEGRGCRGNRRPRPGARRRDLSSSRSGRASCRSRRSAASAAA